MQVCTPRPPYPAAIILLVRLGGQSRPPLRGYMIPQLGGQSRPPLRGYMIPQLGGQSRPPLQGYMIPQLGGQSRPPLQGYMIPQLGGQSRPPLQGCLIAHKGGQSRPPLRLEFRIKFCAYILCRQLQNTHPRQNNHILKAEYVFCKLSNYSALSKPVASLNSLISSSISFACAWTASQVPFVSYHSALRSCTSRACCSTQV